MKFRIYPKIEGDSTSEILFFIAKKFLKLLGLSLMFFALLTNPLVIEKLFSPDQKFDYPSKYLIAGVIDLAIFILGFVSYRWAEFIILVARKISKILFLRIDRQTPKKVFNKIKKLKKEIIVSLISFLVSFILLDQLLFFIVPPAYEIKEFGWKVDSNFSEVRHIHDTPGVFRDVINEYFDHGFKRWGELDSSKVKIFVIGDSVTQATQINNGEEWYAYLEKSFPDATFFVYGGNGYGTTQEYLILDKYFDEINPDIVIWQFIGNDYANNYFKTDHKKFPGNNHSYKPYLENGGIVYRLPLAVPSIRQKSRITDYVLRFYEDRWLEDAWYIKIINRILDVGIDKPSLGNITRQDMEEAFEITLDLFGLINDRVGDRPIFIFNTFEEWGDIFNSDEFKICDMANIHCLNGLSAYIKNLIEQGRNLIVVGDGHWNKEGNRLAGEYLSAVLKSNELFMSSFNQ